MSERATTAAQQHVRPDRWLAFARRGRSTCALAWAGVMRVRVSFVVAAALAPVAAAMLSQHVAYETLVVPQLASVRHVSVVWWVGVAAPVILAALVGGWMAKSWREVVAAAALGAVGLQGYGQWLAQTGRPGWYKSFAVEAPVEYWTIGLLQVFLLLVVLESTGHACRKTRTVS